MHRVPPEDENKVIQEWKIEWEDLKQRQIRWNVGIETKLQKELKRAWVECSLLDEHSSEEDDLSEAVMKVWKECFIGGESEDLIELKSYAALWQTK